MSARADNAGSRGHPRHVIDSAIFELSFGSGPVDWSDEGELARVVERELMSVVNDVFDESAPAAGTVRIDNLEVDLGPLVFDGSWIRVRERLREQLRTAIAHAQTDPAGGQGGPLQALRADLSTAAGFDLLVHFLRFGVLPEQARIQDVKGMEAELREVARAAPQSVAALIRDPALGDVVAVRLVRQFPDSLLRQLVEALSPVDAALMVGLVQRLQQLIGRAGSTVVWKDEIHQVLWVRLLKDLAALNPPPITVTARHAIEDAARAVGRSYGELVDQIRAQVTDFEELAALLGRLASAADARPRLPIDEAAVGARPTRFSGAQTPGSRGVPDRTLQSFERDGISSTAGLAHLLDTLEHGHQKALGRLLQQLRSGDVSLSNLTGKLSTTGHRNLLAGVLKALAQGTGGAGREFQKAVDAHAPRAHSERTFYCQVIERLVADELIDLEAIASGSVLSPQVQDAPHEAQVQTDARDFGAQRAGAESDEMDKPLQKQLLEEAGRSDAGIEKQKGVASGDLSLQGPDLSREARAQSGVPDPGVPRPGARRAEAENGGVGKPLHSQLSEEAVHSGAEVEKREAVEISLQGQDISREAKEQAGVRDLGVPQPGTRRVGAESDEVGTPLQDPLAEKAARSGAEVEKQKAIISGDLSLQGPDLSREAQEQAGVQDPGVQGSVTQRTGVDSVEAEHYLRDYLCNGVVPSNGGNAYLRRAAEHLYALAPQQFAGLVRRSATDEAAVTRLTGLLPESLLTQVLSLLAPAVHDRMLRYADTIVDACHTPELDISAEQFKRLKWQSCFQYLLAGRPHWDPASFLRQFSEQIAAHSQRLESAQLYALMRRRLALTDRTAEGDEPGFESAQVPGLRTGMDQAMTPGTGVETAGATHVTQNRKVLEQGIRISNAGLVLAAPWLPRLFGMLELVEEGAFRHPAARQRAVHLLQYLVDERCDTPEYGLVLNRVLCGLDTAMPLSREIVPVEREKEAIEGLLRGMIQHWKVLKGTSVSGLRETFLQRKGTLRLQDDGWHLAVEPEAFDILIDQIPWSFSMIKHSWMEEVVYVDWR